MRHRPKYVAMKVDLSDASLWSVRRFPQLLARAASKSGSGLGSLGPSERTVTVTTSVGTGKMALTVAVNQRVHRLHN